MTVQTLPTTAAKYQRAQTREIEAALAALSRQWRRMSTADIDAAWRRVGPVMLSVMLEAQSAILEPVPAYMSGVLRETGQAAADDPVAAARASALVGTAGDGRQVAEHLNRAPILAKIHIRDGVQPVSALRMAGASLQSAMSTALSDTARQAEVVETAVRPITGYVRMLTAPSCARCVILAGARYKANQGFQRHPRCDCRHIPASEAVAGDLAADPAAYFRSLPTAAEADDRYPDLSVTERRARGVYTQEDIFTGAGAKAIRNGADVSKVVNARRGMHTAQGRLAPKKVFGREVFTTTERTTARSRWRGGVRLMPESIVKAAENRTELVRLLRLHGYIV